jgi:hypothetical protein
MMPFSGMIVSYCMLFRPLVWYGRETSTMRFFPCSLALPLYYQGKWAETRKTPVSGRFMEGKQDSRHKMAATIKHKVESV